MRINGFNQIKAFYSWTFNNQDKGVKPQHISLYLFLLNQNNRNNWIEWFKCPFDLAMAGSCINSKKTYYKCLNDLQDWKLIKYKKGTNNWKAPMIFLEVLKDTSTVPQSEPLPTQVTTPLPTQLAEQLGTHKYKLITNNIKLVKENIEKWIKDSKDLEDNKEKSFEERKRAFIKWFNESKLKYTGVMGRSKTIAPKDIENLKKLLKDYEFSDFEKAIPNLFKNDWAKETGNLTISHFIKIANFNKYLEYKEQPKKNAYDI